MPDGRAATRRTLARTASCRGVSLFLGAPSSIEIKPRESGGLGFRRMDVAGSPEIAALVGNVAPENRRTVIVPPGGAAAAGGGVQTVEHLMSALAGFGITDALVEVSGPELPIGDGSALPFAQAISDAGIRELGAAESGGDVRPVIVREPITIADEKSGARIEALPHDEPGLRITYNLAYPPGAPIAPQSATLFVPFGRPVDRYREDVAPARTFSLQQEAEMARAMGLFKHLSPKDMLVIGADGPIDNAYRFDNEPARHKLLDALGDLALSGLLARGTQAHVVCTRTGHAHNHAMAKALFALAAAG